MYHLRDHIVSLVAVFLALGLGILIGTGLSDDMLVTQQRLLIERMTEEFTELRGEINRLETCIDEQQKDLLLWEKYQEALYPAVVYGVLAERKIALVCCGTGIPSEVTQLLQDARAAVGPLIRIESLENRAVNPEYTAETVLDILVKEPFRPERLQADGIREEKGIYLAGEQWGKPDTVLFILGEREHAAAEVLERLLKGLQSEGILTVGLEESEVKNSLLPVCKAAGASTIDNIDTVFGRFSLLSVLQGSRGSYGVKGGADAFIATFSLDGGMR